ncbi:MAG: hypothetical protein COC01_02075 [Bacteroidetes bacterium]|nr:MAG: hypothetical protein COC01_02075 [Bacteroidota bacterium]
MRNQGKIVKSRLVGNYTTIKNEFLRDATLSAKAKGLLCYLLSFPHDFVIYKTRLSNHFTDGKHSLTSGFQELETSGYIMTERIRDKNGRFEGYKHVVYEERMTEKPIAENPLSVNPTSVNQPLKRKKVKKKERTKKEKYDFEFFNDDFETVWCEYLKMRKAIGKPATKHAEMLALQEAQKLCDGNSQLAMKIVEQSIRNSWTDFFPIRSKNGQQKIEKPVKLISCQP